MPDGGSPRDRAGGDPVSSGRGVSEEAQARPVDGGNAASFSFEFVRARHGQPPGRPSTSAGHPSDLARKKTEKIPDTLDERHLNPHADGLGTTLNRFPLPGSPPTPVGSPTSSQQPSTRKPQSTRPSTPDSWELKPADMTAPPLQQQIGMALGSPRHSPAAWPARPPTGRHPETPDLVADELAYAPPPTRQKTSKWKRLFGGKRSEAPPASLYSVRPGATQQAASYGFDFGQPPVTNDQPARSGGRARSNSIRRPFKHKATMYRSNTEPPRAPVGGKGEKQLPANPELSLGGGPVVYGGSRPIHKGAGLLDVDIPSIQMERYSIMFGSLLEKPESLQSSLLARRQATLDKLRTLNEEIDLKVRKLHTPWQRPHCANGGSKEREPEAQPKSPLTQRATSPGLPPRNQSPAFSLFPLTPHTTQPPSGSPLGHQGAATVQRSNTSPPGSSPSRPSFAPGVDNEDHANLVDPDSPTVPLYHQTEAAHEHRGSRPRRDGPRPVREAPTPATRGNNWSEQSHLVLDSPSDDEGYNYHVRGTIGPEPIAVAIPMRPTMPESRWQMANRSASHPTKKYGSDSSTGSNTSTSTIASSITTPLSQSTAPFPVVNPLRLRAPSASQNWRPAATRSRSTTTGTAPSALPRRGPQVAQPLSPASLNLSSPRSDEDEALLETAADVSIARQISVSRRQRQLLVPIKTSLRAPGPEKLVGGSRDTSPEEHAAGAQSFPASESGVSPISVGHVSSPLGALANASNEEIERFSPAAEKGDRRARDVSPNTERLIQGLAKPSTPTLVVVGRDVGAMEQAWAGATARPKQGQHPSPMGFSEGRRQRLASQQGHAPQNSMVGEIRVGLAVSRDSSPARQANVNELKYRKSERAVIEGARVRN
ncbi:hypothetical protein B2J93_6060 [Marssonina coronariae]|uniref:Uncharacterized protein n=1 Tax=Diplocarpon coronariae TaxID=2795749 RepID=A0A218Z6N2_9HELO|nr:hypothetical protein B2J93_6060 [Marssonina coronariae]